MTTIDLRETYLQLLDGSEVKTIEVGPSFWQELSERRDLQQGRMVSLFPYKASWTSWERHPAGDEVVLVISGQVQLVVESDGAESRTELNAGEAVLVPQGLWHTADVVTPALVLHITRGQGTEHRPR